MERMNRQQYFMAMAELAAKRSPCERRQIGAIAVLRDRIIATGYNGPPAGMEHCTMESCIRIKNKIPSGTQLEMCRAIHAEANLLVQCATSGVSMNGAIVYCTHTPCTSCIKLLLGANIHKLVCKEWYPDAYTKELLTLAGYVNKEDFQKYDELVAKEQLPFGYARMPLHYPYPIGDEDYIVYEKADPVYVQKLYHVPA